MGDNVVSQLSQGESVAYMDGVIEGYHDFAKHIKAPFGPATREELLKFDFYTWVAVLHPVYTVLQTEDWIQGYKDGYNFRRSK